MIVSPTADVAGALPVLTIVNAGSAGSAGISRVGLHEALLLPTGQTPSVPGVVIVAVLRTSPVSTSVWLTV